MNPEPNEVPTVKELFQDFVPDPKPHYYHGLKIGHEGQKPRHFRKITRSERFPDVLVDIAQVAFEARRLFGSPLIVEYATHEVPVKIISVPEDVLTDESYIEADPMEPLADGMIGIPDAEFWTLKKKLTK